MLADIKIDKAQLADIPQLVDLLAELFSIEADFEADSSKQIQGLQLIINQPERAVIQVARHARLGVVGMVSAQLVISTAQGTPSAWVEDMVISPQFRAAGLGKALLQALQDWAKLQGASRMQLLVDIANTTALGYYQHLGWQATQLQARRLFLGNAE